MYQDEYDIHNLQKIIPSGQNYEMFITPRYIEHYVNHAYEPITSRIISTHIGGGGIFVDIGAHYGFYTLLAANQPKVSKIFSFEPVPVNFQILKQNIELNSLQNVELFNQAVSDKNEVRKLKITEASDSCGFYDHPNSTTIDEVDINTVNLDSVFDRRVDVETFIKIDAEGHEISILAGMKELIGTSLSKLKIIIEYNPKMLERANHTPGELVSRLFNLGFQVFTIDEEKKILQKIDNNQIGHSYKELVKVDQSVNYINLYCVPKERSTSAVFFSHSSGLYGAERSLLTMVSELIQKNVICNVILPSEGGLKTNLENAGAFTRIFPYGWWSDVNKIDLQTCRQRLRESFGIVWKEIVPYLIQINPDLLITNTAVIPWGAVCAFLLDKPHIWYVREFGDADYEFHFFYPQQIISNYIEGSSNTVITNSNAIKEYYFGDMAQQKVQTIYPPIDYDLVKDLSSKKNPNFYHHDTIKLAVIGTIHAGKGQIEAIYAVNEIINMGKKVELVLAGSADPEYYESVHGLIEQYNLQSYVHVVDFLENPYPLFLHPDIIIICSRNEAFGRVILEAMSLGKAVIATNSGGIPEIIEDGETGLLYKPGDYKELAQKIIELIEDPVRRLQIGAKAAQHVQSNFSKEVSIEQLLDILYLNKKLTNNSSREFIYWTMGLIKDRLADLTYEIDQQRSSWDHVRKKLVEQDTENNHQAETMQQQYEDVWNHIIALQQQVVERDGCVTRLRQENKEKDNEIISLQQQIAQRDNRITSIQDQLVDIQLQSIKLHDRLENQEIQSAKQLNRVTEFEQQNSILHTQKNNLELELVKLKNHLRQREQILQSLNSTLLDIYSSTAWKIIRLMWTIRLVLAPIGSKREKLIKRVMAILRKPNKNFENYETKNLSSIEPVIQDQYQITKIQDKDFILNGKSDPVLITEITKYRAIYDQLILVSKDLKDPEYTQFSETKLVEKDQQVKLIAFYLPQYHPTPENDLHWGRGFTEWTNVTKAIPQFLGHYQPRLPGELGFYDLRIPTTLNRQVELARNYGIFGFCFHYYWFSGKKLLETPLNHFISDNNINFPFCICWANENWTRRWDGREDEILIEQKHSINNDKKFIADIEPLLRHKNYIKIEDRPLIIVYRANILQDARKTAAVWRKYCAKKGLNNPYLVAAQTFGFTDPNTIGFDAAVEFPPHNLRNKNITNEVSIINKEFTGNVFSYPEMVEASIEVPYNPDYRLIKTVFPSWDNEPRKPGRGTIFTGSTPRLYEHWLTEVSRWTIEYYPPNQRFVFINAWNEWGEGAYLEPDRKFGYAYLQATADSLKSLVG